MNAIYSFMDMILPFEFIHYTFMKNALLAILLVTPLFGMLGTMAVDNKMAFFSDALGHSALTGIAIGVVGMAMALSTYPIHKRMMARRRKKFAPEIIKLSEKIMQN